MAVKIENTPSPDILMNSMRSMGYSFKTAIADIIDNSISAESKNIYIYTPINDEDIFVSILDDGVGMDRNELLNAMKYGSARDSYGRNDLGRFGLGLKSASLSQCRKLTVASKKNGTINAFRWDLDYVLKDKTWGCLELSNEEIQKIPNIDSLIKQEQGTLVVWENFDIAYKKSEGHIREYLSSEVESADKHLRLIFHRFLNRKQKPVHIYINNLKLIGYDPFLESNPKTDTENPRELSVENEIIKIQPYILPHQTDISNEEMEKLGGAKSFREGQGFYIYRNDRLIIYGTWFKISVGSVKSELYKYGRIKVDIPNSLDDIWEIDIKKQNATIPKVILNNLKKEVANVCRNSESKISKRARLTLDKDNNKIWNKVLVNQKESFSINIDSKFINEYIEDFDDKQKKKIYNLLNIISANLPIDDIYNSVCQKKISTTKEQFLVDSIVSAGIDLIQKRNRILKIPVEECFETMCKSEPFNDENISKLILEEINKWKTLNK